MWQYSCLGCCWCIILRICFGKVIWESLKNDSFLRKKQIFSVENYCLRDFLRRFLYKHTTVLKICSNFVQN